MANWLIQKYFCLFVAQSGFLSPSSTSTAVLFYLHSCAPPLPLALLHHMNTHTHTLTHTHTHTLTHLHTHTYTHIHIHTHTHTLTHTHSHTHTLTHSHT